MEWPTLGLIIALYGLFGLVTWFHDSLPWWLLLAIGGYLVCLHGSLQHEVVHGHPTPWPLVNEMLVLPSLWLWLPFRSYRRLHLAHHDDTSLTDPRADPESYYVTPERWDRFGALQRSFFWAHNTVAGRLLLGPPYCVIHTLRSLFEGCLRGRSGLLNEWLAHGAGVALVLSWVLWVCGMAFLEYIVYFAYPGVALTLLRSFLEHQARERPGERTVLIEAGPFFSLLFLNNNLHALHHAEPGLPWYRLPARYRERRSELLAGNGHYRFSGYAEVIARYLLWPKETPRHPVAGREGVPSSAPELALGGGVLRQSHAFSPSKLG